MTDQVSDVTVRAIIYGSLAKQDMRPGETVANRVSRAFRELQERRQTVDPLNINLAAAEHYMYARFLAAASGDPSVKLAPILYGLKKRLYFAFGIQQRMAATQNPVLLPNAAVERWGSFGATEGLVDYKAITGKSATNYGKAISTLTLEARRYN